MFSQAYYQKFYFDKQNKSFHCFTLTGICDCEGWACVFGLLTRAKPLAKVQSTFNSFLLEYSPACERTTLATERIWVSENDDDVSSLGVMPVPLGLAPLGPGSIGSSYCFELPFFFFSSLTLLLCSASFFQLRHALGLYLVYYSLVIIS